MWFDSLCFIMPLWMFFNRSLFNTFIRTTLTLHRNLELDNMTPFPRCNTFPNVALTHSTLKYHLTPSCPRPVKKSIFCNLKGWRVLKRSKVPKITDAASEKVKQWSGCQMNNIKNAFFGWGRWPSKFYLSLSQTRLYLVPIVLDAFQSNLNNLAELVTD